MNNKQIIGLVAAALVFVFVGASSVLSQTVSKSILNSTSTETKTSFDSLMDEIEGNATLALPMNDYVGVVEVDGVIQEGVSTGSNMFEAPSYQHEKTLDYIDQMMDSDTNTGILLYVNSPGGTVYASDELYLKLKEYKEVTNRPVWTYMASEACSGGYYISMASDKIYANRNCWTGSIGVIISMYNTKGLFDKIGVKEIDITSGKNKAMGSSGLDMTQEQKDILQGMVDESYEQFTGIVSEGRNMDIAKVKELADGRIYTALQAKDAGLVDEIAGYEEAKSAFTESLGYDDVEFYVPSFNKGNIFSSLFSAYRSTKTRSDAEVMQQFIENLGSGVPMYYAEIGE
ncbi:MAG: signal peptide peptidase SppA [Lachnospiraceae bacterium]|nr:signal peptide peptidase SppA [Lachnospiraceae bacterium]